MSEPMPLYRTIAEDLRRQISTGELAPGDRLKSEAELMEAYGRDGKASRNTVRDAIKFLASRGLVETRAGQGTFVVETMQPFAHQADPGPGVRRFRNEVYRSEAQRQGREQAETTPRVEVQPASAAHRLPTGRRRRNTGHQPPPGAVDRRDPVRAPADHLLPDAVRDRGRRDRPARTRGPQRRAQRRGAEVPRIHARRQAGGIARHHHRAAAPRAWRGASSACRTRHWSPSSLSSAPVTAKTASRSASR